MKSPIIITIVLFATLFSGCKKNKNEDPSDTAMGTLAFHAHTVVNSTEVEAYNTVYTLDNGRKITVSTAQLYISEVQLVKLDGSVCEVGNAPILKLREIEALEVGAVPAGNYKSIRFKVGLNASVNHTLPSNSNLTLYRPEMWLGNSVDPDGFVFVNFQGTVDTSVAADNTELQMQPFSYKIGTDAHLTQIEGPEKNYSILPNEAEEIHFYIDYSKLFTDIQLNNSSNLIMETPSDNATALGIQIKNNIPNLFIFP